MSDSKKPANYPCGACCIRIAPPPDYESAYMAGMVEADEVKYLCDFHKNLYDSFMSVKKEVEDQFLSERKEPLVKP